MKISHWIEAARPKTLPAAAMPVLAGSALAYNEVTFHWVPALICLGFAFLMQIGTNFANDYLDYERGSDTADRIGPPRAVASGWIAPGTMRRAAIGVLAVGFALGCLLIAYGGWMLLGIGLASVLCAWIYTGGPKPLAYIGLGDLFVVLFFGLIAVGFTYYVQAGAFSTLGWVLGLGIGLLVNNILVINNYRDAEQDRDGGKRTLTVRFGRGFAILQYQLSITVASLIPLVFLMNDYSTWILGAVLVYPAGRWLTLKISRMPIDRSFNRALGWTSALLIAYGLLISAGLVLDRLL